MGLYLFEALLFNTLLNLGAPLTGCPGQQLFIKSYYRQDLPRLVFLLLLLYYISNSLWVLLALNRPAKLGSLAKQERGETVSCYPKIGYGDSPTRVHRGRASRRRENDNSNSAGTMQSGRALRPIPITCCPGAVYYHLDIICQKQLSFQTEDGQVDVKRSVTTCVRDKKLYICVEFETQVCKQEHRQRCFEAMQSLIERVLEDLRAQNMPRQYRQEFGDSLTTTS